MEKFCVFCGVNPESKNKEHIIPKWLIRLTGDPNRTINLPFYGSLEVVQRSFSSFHFPACRSCNTDFSLLEEKAKPIVVNLLKGAEVSCEDLHVFFDWLDKIRIGLWLGALYLGGHEMFGIKPKFQIAKRLGAKDRMVVIYRTDNQQSGVGFLGANMPIFAHSPSCFTLIINSLVFFNVSADHLFARRIGFPYPSRSTVHDSGLLELEMAPGRERIMHPIVKFQYSPSGTEIFQPIYNSKAYTSDFDDLKKLYDTSYVRNLSYDHEKGIGIPLIVNDKKVTPYPRERSANWYPKHIFPFQSFLGECFDQTLRTQCTLLDESPYVSHKQTRVWGARLKKVNLTWLKSRRKFGKSESIV